MIGAGVIGIVQGALCMLFPFMAARGTDAAEKRGRKKSKKSSRGSVTHLSPVPEEHPNGLDPVNGVHLDGKGRQSSGVLPPMPSARATSVVDMMTWQRYIFTDSWNAHNDPV